MPLVEKPMSEKDLREQIARLERLIKANPATAVQQNQRLTAAKDELNRLLLNQGGYSVVKDSEVAALVEAARKEGHAAGVAEAKAALEKTE